MSTQATQQPSGGASLHPPSLDHNAQAVVDASDANGDDDDIPAHKCAIRAAIWRHLSAVALPDSRFDTDFSSFIADFVGSDDAVTRLVALPEYVRARVVFVAPDNCLEGLRARALADGKVVLVTTYGIRRGFVVLEPGRLEAAGVRGEWGWRYAATLEGMERVGRRVRVGEVCEELGGVDLMVTGSGAVSARGVRFGKGHGFFDLEWGMLYSVGAVDGETAVVGVVHDCQVVEEGGVVLRPDVFDTVCDVVVTPTRTLRVEGAVKPRVGIMWERLAEGMEESIPPLRELREMMVREGKTSTVELRGEKQY